jgi:hypothetical protein
MGWQKVMLFENFLEQRNFSPGIAVTGGNHV